MEEKLVSDEGRVEEGVSAGLETIPELSLNCGIGTRVCANGRCHAEVRCVRFVQGKTSPAMLFAAVFPSISLTSSGLLPYRCHRCISNFTKPSVPLTSPSPYGEYDVLTSDFIQITTRPYDAQLPLSPRSNEMELAQRSNMQPSLRSRYDDPHSCTIWHNRSLKS
jgi:hypothetical protein